MSPATDSAFIGVVGGGIAGAALAWRLARAPYRLPVRLFTAGTLARADASSASGGLVRGFEASPEATRAASASLAELLADRRLRAWSQYTQTGFTYVLPEDLAPEPNLKIVDAAVPDSARIERAAVPAGRAVVERRAGYIRPGALRDGLIADVAGKLVTVDPRRVGRIGRDGAVLLESGGELRFEVLVLAAGPWTPGLLGASGLPSGGLRAKQIQYTLCDVPVPGLGGFLHAATGLYGRPTEDGRLLLGLHCERWDVDPETPRPDRGLISQVVEIASRVVGACTDPARYARTVVSADCFHPDGVLALRPVSPGAPRLFTFSGGSGAAAKTVLQASAAAASGLAAL